MDTDFLPLLNVESLCVEYRDDNGYNQVVNNVSFSITEGETVVLVGESGSGKSTISQAIIGLLANNGLITSGKILFNNQEISSWSSKRLQNLRGSVISLIPQDPVSSLNPIKKVGEQVAEMFLIHQKATKQYLRDKVIELFIKVGLSHPQLRYDQYPHELSGGMRQRVLIAMAIALKPKLIIADEPTSALDVTVQKQILELIEELKHELGTAVLLVTHDLGIAADYGNRIIVLKKGQIQEQGTVENLLINPKNSYTKQLLADIPNFTTTHSIPKPPHHYSSIKVIEVVNLSKQFIVSGNKQPFLALDNISFSVMAGETHAIVGESGSGKTTTISNLLGIQQPSQGEIFIFRQDITKLKGEKLRQIRRRLQLVHQNPFMSLDPKQSIFKIIEEPLLNFEPIDKKIRYQRVMELIEKVGLPTDIAKRKPIALSGGQRQRVAIARALILKPDILILDEAVSALDVTVQAQILKLLSLLQTEFNLTYLFISHDLAVVKQFADSVSVMRNGEIIESGSIDSIFSSPQHEYTHNLINAIPGYRQGIL